MQAKMTLWAGRVLSALPIIFLSVDSVMKFMKPLQVVEATTKLGYSEDLIIPLGITLLICTVLYAIPRTTMLGAILLTGYLGGAVASHVRIGDSLFGHIMFPVYVGFMVWAGLFLRNHKVRNSFL